MNSGCIDRLEIVKEQEILRIRSECKRLEAEVISVQTRLYQRDLIRLLLEGLIDGVILDYFS